MKRYHKCVGIVPQTHTDAQSLAQLLTEQLGVKVSVSSAIKWAVEKALKDMQVKSVK